MSNTTKSIIARQWQIIDFLLQVGNYVSTSQIQSHLKEKGMEAEMRTVQRDLKLLQEIIPLECRTDDKPYSWRWQRLDNANEHHLNLTQAVAFRLIETELKQHIPSDLMLQLDPILMKARFVLAMANVPESMQQAMLLNSSNNKPHGFVQLNTFNKMIIEARKIINYFNFPENPFLKKTVEITKKERKTIAQLNDVLKELDLNELAKEFNEI